MVNEKMRGTLLPMNLQFFADDVSGGADAAGAAGGDGTQGAGTQAGTEGAGAEGGAQSVSFDDFLKDPKNQSEFDKRVAKALETNRTKIEAEVEARVAAAKTEAEKLAKMNADEKAKYEQQKRDEELAKREDEITKRELSAQAKETLADKGLPIQLADILNYSDAKACQASIDAVEKAFQEAVSKGIDEKLRGGDPIKKAPVAGGTFTKEQIEKMSAEEINKNWDAIQASLKAGL